MNPTGRRTVSDLILHFNNLNQSPETKTLGRSASVSPQMPDAQKAAHLANEKMPSLNSSEEKQVCKWVGGAPSRPGRVIPDSAISVGPAKAEVPPSFAEATRAETAKAATESVEATRTAWSKGSVAKEASNAAAKPVSLAHERAVPEHRASVKPPNTPTVDKTDTTGTEVLQGKAAKAAPTFTKEQKELYLNAFAKALDDIKGKNLKIVVKKDPKNPSGFEIKTAKRGKWSLFGRFGRKKETVAMKDLLRSLGGQVFGDNPALAIKYINIMEGLSSHEWGAALLAKFNDEFTPTNEAIKSFFGSKTSEEQKQIREAFIIANNPEASKSELEQAKTTLKNSLEPGKEKDKLNAFYETLIADLQGRIDDIEVKEKEMEMEAKDREMKEKDRIDTLEMKEVLLGGEDRDLLISAVGWVVPGEKMARIFDVALSELNEMNKSKTNPEQFSQSLTMLLDASVKLVTLPKAELGDRLDKNSLHSKLFDVATLAAETGLEEHVNLGIELGKELGQVSDRVIPKKEITIKDAPNALNSTTVLREIASFEPPIDRNTGKPIEGAVSPNHNALLKSMAADLRSQLREHMLSVDQREFRKLAWSKEDAREKYAPNLSAFTASFNDISGRVEATLISPETVNDKQQVGQLINFYIDLMDECIKDNNFFAAQAINSALHKGPINRFINDKNGNPTGLVEEKHMAKQKEMNELLMGGHNFKNYRAKLADVLSTPGAGKAPIPFTGPLVSDLTFINDGNPNTTSLGKTNLDKQSKFEAELNKFREAQKQLKKERKASSEPERQTQFFTAPLPNIPKLPPPKPGEEKLPDTPENRLYYRSLALIPSQRKST